MDKDLVAYNRSQAVQIFADALVDRLGGYSFAAQPPAGPETRYVSFLPTVSWKIKVTSEGKLTATREGIVVTNSDPRIVLDYIVANAIAAGIPDNKPNAW